MTIDLQPDGPQYPKLQFRLFDLFSLEYTLPFDFQVIPNFGIIA